MSSRLIGDVKLLKAECPQIQINLNIYSNKEYEHLRKESEKYLGWQLLRPLDPRDEHHLKSLESPSPLDEQSDFDDLVSESHKDTN